MNQRLLELAKQAGLKKDHVSDREYIGDFDWREFAELIIQDCISNVEVWEKDSRNHISYMMKEHFGVKNDIT